MDCENEIKSLAEIVRDNAFTDIMGKRFTRLVAFCCDEFVSDNIAMPSRLWKQNMRPVRQCMICTSFFWRGHFCYVFIILLEMSFYAGYNST